MWRMLSVDEKRRAQHVSLGTCLECNHQHTPIRNTMLVSEVVSDQRWHKVAVLMAESGVDKHERRCWCKCENEQRVMRRVMR